LALDMSLLADDDLILEAVFLALESFSYPQ
jgi:hypothetical protein